MVLFILLTILLFITAAGHIMAFLLAGVGPAVVLLMGFHVSGWLAFYGAICLISAIVYGVLSGYEYVVHEGVRIKSFLLMILHFLFFPISALIARVQSILYGKKSGK